MKPPISVMLFAKAPVPGTVKTRLIPVLGAEAAAQLAERLAEQTLEAALASQVGPVSLWGSPDAAHPFFRKMEARYGITLESQEGADVGVRMEHALNRALRSHAAAILTGTDLWHPSPALFTDAARALTTGATAVLAPSVDGGYVLIGLTRPIPGLFREMAWGTERVCRETVQRLEARDCPFVMLPLHRDLDTPEDYAAWRSTNE